MDIWKVDVIGDPHETMTPLIAWGAGIGGPEKRSKKSNRSGWKLPKLEEFDVEQADLAPLMSSLIGVGIPVNSMGRLPVDYMNVSEEYGYEAVCANYRQLLEQFEAVRKMKKSKKLWFMFWEYEKYLPERMIEIRKEAERKDYKKASEMCLNEIKILLEGIEYFHRYDRMFLSISIGLGYISYMMLVWRLIITNYWMKWEDLLPTGKRLWFLMGCCGVLWIFGLEWKHYLYPIVPGYLYSLNIWIVKGSRSDSWDIRWMEVIGIICGVELLIGAFFYRITVEV